MADESSQPAAVCRMPGRLELSADELAALLRISHALSKYRDREALFLDAESSVEVPASVGDVRTAYSATVREVIAEWRAMLSGAGVSYETIATDQPFGVPLRRAFAARQRLP